MGNDAKVTTTTSDRGKRQEVAARPERRRGNYARTVRQPLGPCEHTREDVNSTGTSPSSGIRSVTLSFLGPEMSDSHTSFRLVATVMSFGCGGRKFRFLEGLSKLVCAIPMESA